MLVDGRIRIRIWSTAGKSIKSRNISSNLENHFRFHGRDRKGADVIKKRIKSSRCRVPLSVQRTGFSLPPRVQSGEIPRHVPTYHGPRPHSHARNTRHTVPSWPPHGVEYLERNNLKGQSLKMNNLLEMLMPLNLYILTVLKLNLNVHYSSASTNVLLVSSRKDF